MYDHVTLKVKDLGASVRFYTSTLGALGYQLCTRDETGAGFGPAGAPAFWLSATMVAPVGRFHADGLKAGGRDNGVPGPRPDYGPTYYAAFLFDPDGNNIEAVCMK
jgi:catechol 2,3-dioxygenase-like lactoylglutathione lyase family enzyme